MKITVLDRAAIGLDTPLDLFEKFGELTIFDSTAPFEMEERLKNAEILVINKVKITKEILSCAKALKLICVFATGYDNIDLAAAENMGIAVCNVPGYSTDSVAQFTFATVLSLICHMEDYREYVRDGSYSESSSANLLVPVYNEINGKTWGIVGYGNIGKKVASIAKAFGANVVVTTRTATADYPTLDIDELAKISDIISLHCPLTDKTRNLINRDIISLMKRNVILVNEARGAVLSEKDVADAISEGRIGAFGSDVYSIEPFPKDHPFYQIKDMKNVILTPHAAWASYESRCRCVDIICDNINSYLNGGTKNRVDLSR